MLSLNAQVLLHHRRVTVEVFFWGARVHAISSHMLLRGRPRPKGVLRIKSAPVLVLI